MLLIIYIMHSVNAMHPWARYYIMHRRTHNLKGKLKNNKAWPNMLTKSYKGLHCIFFANMSMRLSQTLHVYLHMFGSNKPKKYRQRNAPMPSIESITLEHRVKFSVELCYLLLNENKPPLKYIKHSHQFKIFFKHLHF